MSTTARPRQTRSSGILETFAVAFAALLVVAGAAAAQSHTPPQGSPERKAILDALRPMVEAEVGKPVEFVVDQMNVLGEWAFVIVRPQRPGGGPIPYVYSRYQAAADADVFGGEAVALLRDTPAGWLVYEYDLGATDVVWLDWPQYYPAPAEVFEIK